MAATIIEEKIVWSHSYIVKQYHFTAWTEDDQPDKEKLFKFLLCTRYFTQLVGKSSTLIHSEIGSDWAAIYIAVDYMMDRLISNPEIDVIGVTNALRIQRPMMISRLEIYMYLYNFVHFIIIHERFEDYKYIGFKEATLPERPKSESLPSEADSRDSEEGSVFSKAQSQTRSVSRAASRQVSTAGKSIARSVSQMSQAILNVVEEVSNDALSTVKEDTADQSSKV